MATFEKREYRNKKTGKVTIRHKAKIRLKGFPYEEATFDRLSDARDWAAKREYEIEHQKHFGAEFHRTKTLAELLERYEAALALSNPKRYKDVFPVLKIWKGRIGSVKLRDLTQDIIIRERDRLKTLHVKGNVKLPLCSNSRVNRMFGIFKCALNVAVIEWKWLSSNPADGIKMLEEPTGRTRFLSAEELKRFLEACKLSANKDLYAMALLGLTTGARRGEIMKIKLTHVDFQQSRILLPTTKNKKPRMLYLQEPALGLIKSVYEKTKVGQVYLFASPHDVKKPNDFRTAWHTALKRAEIEDFRFHDVRHTAASLMAKHGAGLHEISDILGHSDIKVTQRYVHLLKNHSSGIVKHTAEQVFGDGKTQLEEC